MHEASRRIQNETPQHQKQTRRNLLSVSLTIGLTLIIWEVYVRARQIPIYILPSPSRIALHLAHEAPRYALATIVTLGEAIGGLCLGLCIGIIVAIVITFWTNLERGVLALAILLKATPMVAIAPLLIIWLGFGPLPKVILTAIITFFPVLINVHSGLRAADPALLDLFHSLHANRREIFSHVLWPTALPYLFAALKVVAPLSLVGAVVAEWAGASTGLGRTMWLAYTNLNLPALFAAVFCSATMGVGLYSIVIALEKHVIFWQRTDM